MINQGWRSFPENGSAGIYGSDTKFLPAVAAIAGSPQIFTTESLGLYKIPTHAKWKSAHAIKGRTSESRVRENNTHGLLRESWAGQPWSG